MTGHTVWGVVHQLCTEYNGSTLSQRRQTLGWRWAGVHSWLCDHAGRGEHGWESLPWAGHAPHLLMWTVHKKTRKPLQWMWVWDATGLKEIQGYRYPSLRTRMAGGRKPKPGIMSTMVVAALVALCAMVAMAVGLVTDHWLEYRVSGLAIPSDQLGSPIYYDRDRGLIRTCFNSDDSHACKYNLPFNP